MTSHFYLTLDTRGPHFEIFAPSYTTRHTLTPIAIQADEPIASNQEIYLIDAEGDRHDLTFAVSGDKIDGELYFDGYPLGITTLYARLKDEVDNLSPLQSHKFSLIENEFLTSKLNLVEMSNKTDIVEMVNSLSLATMRVEVILE